MRCRRANRARGEREREHKRRFGSARRARVRANTRRTSREGGRGADRSTASASGAPDANSAARPAAAELPRQAVQSPSTTLTSNTHTSIVTVSHGRKNAISDEKCVRRISTALTPSERACCSRSGGPHRQRRLPGKGSADVSKRGNCSSASHTRLVLDGGLCATKTRGAHPCHTAARGVGGLDKISRKRGRYRAPLATTSLSSRLDL